MIGTTISRYKIVAKLGEGGMGVVYKAEDQRLKRTVALKFLPVHALGKGEQRARFEREAQAAASLNHPNICTIFEIDEVDGRPFIAMECVEGETLTEWIEKGPLTIDDAIDIALQSARGLAAAHEKRVVHRDIKSANIMVTREAAGRERQAKLMDFGLARLADANSQLTKDGTTLGTTAYMAPEQAEGREVDERADIWALGVVLYELVTGQQPFRGEYAQAVLYGVLNEKHEALGEVREGVPAALERIVDTALAKNASERYQSAERMAADLRELQRVRESGSSLPPAVAQPGANKVWLAAAALVAIAVLAAAWLLSERTASTPAAPAPAGLAAAVPFTSFPGIEQDAAFSPDGNQVAFSWNGDDQQQFDIYIKLRDSSSQLRLTDDPADDLRASWSPDGRTIAFVRTSPAEAGIYLIPPLGGQARKLTEIEPFDYGISTNLAWSPDSSALFFSDSGKLFRIALATGEREEFNPRIHGMMPWLAISPDGERMALSTLHSPALVRVLDMSSRDVVAENTAQFPLSVAWTPDSAEILVSSIEAGLRRGAPGGDLRPLATGARLVGSLATSPGGSLIYESVDSDVDMLRFSLADPAGEPDRSIASSTRAESSARISPNGAKITFASRRTGEDEIWTADADGSGAVQLTSGSTAQNGSPSLSPDGTQVAFDSIRNGTWDIFVVDAQGGPARLVAGSDASDSRPSWSHDGEWIYFTSTRGGQPEIWKVPAAGGEALRLSRNGGGRPRESPDGRYVYYAGQLESEAAIYRIPAGGGEGTAVLSALDRDRIAGVLDGWALTRRAIYYLSRDESFASRGQQLKRFDLDTKETRVVKVFNSDSSGANPISIAPDESWGLYMQRNTIGTDLMLVEKFQ